jgi:hypothetical protein
MNKWCFTITKRMRWMGPTAHMGEKRNACNVLGVKHEEKRQLQDLGADGRIILQCIFRNSMLGHRLDLLDSRQAVIYTVMSSLCEMWDIFYWHSNCQLCSVNFDLICLVLK